MKRADMVRYGAETLFNTETAIDLALNQSANLISELTRMRVDGKLNAMLGQDAFNSAADALSKLTAAREAIVLTHQHLDTVKTDLGCQTVAIGAGYAKPPKGSAETSVEARDLSAA